jgi:hypothetical protein
MGCGVGAVVGGAAGGALGLGLGSAATAMIPGVGPVVLLGVVTALLAGGGALGGAEVGGALDHAADDGIAKDELFFYRDALRRGRTVVIVTTSDDDEATRARGIFETTGAESIDAARRAWWLGLRDAGDEHYET